MSDATSDATFGSDASSAAPPPPSGIDVPADTPPMAGPTPTTECEETDEINCEEPLILSRHTLCARSQPALSPAVTGSQALATTLKPMTGGAMVDVVIVTYGGEKPEGNPSETLASPTLDLKIAENDLDPSKPGKQIGVETDGTVRFHVIAGEKTGYYEVRVTGDLDTASGGVSIEACEPSLADPEDPPPAGPQFKSN